MLVTPSEAINLLACLLKDAIPKSNIWISKRGDSGSSGAASILRDCAQMHHVTMSRSWSCIPIIFYY